MAAEQTEGKKEEGTAERLFRDITADEDVPEITQLESLCVNCEQQGTTRLFLTRIPFFKEVIVSSFNCDQCGYKNSELIPAGRIQDDGVRITVNIHAPQDLNRQVVLAACASIRIPELDFEIPPASGALTNVEGVLDRAIEGLSQDQPLRKALQPEVAVKIEDFLDKLRQLKEGKQTFNFVLDDPSGNSHVENPYAPKKDPNTTVTHYKRSKEQNLALGLPEDTDEEEEKFDSKEVMTFPGNCPNCNTPCPTNMKLVDIPHFKEVVIMATSCDACGYRENEVKGASGIEDKGKKITLRITEPSDMCRDLLKSDTCAIAIPELDFETGIGTLGGKFTTVEGLLNSVKDMLTQSNPFVSGDSSTGSMKQKLHQVCENIDKIISGEHWGVHLVLDDPAGNSYLQNVYAPEEDPELKEELYQRNDQQNDDLGLTHMNTDNYATNDS